MKIINQYNILNSESSLRYLGFLWIYSVANSTISLNNKSVVWVKGFEPLKGCTTAS